MNFRPLIEQVLYPRRGIMHTHMAVPVSLGEGTYFAPERCIIPSSSFLETVNPIDPKCCRRANLETCEPHSFFRCTA